MPSESSFPDLEQFFGFGTRSRRRSGAAAARRRGKRDEVFPGSAAEIFDTSLPETVGYVRVPRLLPLVTALVNSIGQRVSAGSLYLTLWAYDFGQGFVEIRNPIGVLFEAGYSVSIARAERTWNERIAVLTGARLIRTATNGLLEHGYVLLRDPHRAVFEMQRAGELNGEYRQRWLTVFRQRCLDLGVDPDRYVSEASGATQGGRLEKAPNSEE